MATSYSKVQSDGNDLDFKAILDKVQQIFWIVDSDGNIQYCNAWFFTYSGLTKEKVIGQAWWRLLPAEEAHKARKQWKDGWTNHQAYIGAFKRMTDNASRRHLIQMVPLTVPYDSVVRWFAIAIDVEDWSTLADSQSLLLSIIDSSHDAITSFDLNGVILTWNPGAEIMFGYKSEEVIGKSVLILVPQERADEPQQLLSVVGQGGTITQYETVWLKKSHTPFDVCLTLSPIKTAGGEITGIAAIIQDITARKLMERENRRLYDETIAALQIRDEFLSISAHELKTPIAAIRLFAELLIRQIDTGAELNPKRLHVTAQAFDQQSKKLLDLVNRLLDISNIDRGTLALAQEQVDLAKLVRDVVTVARTYTYGDKNPIHVDTPPQLMAFIDPLRIEQVLMNLLDNAIKYSQQGGPISVELIANEPDSAQIIVRDQGIGIPAEHRDHIFDRFYQGHTHVNYGGLGLGLYVTRYLVELHGGRLTVDSPSEGGAQFMVTLPLGQEEVNEESSG